MVSSKAILAGFGVLAVPLIHPHGWPFPFTFNTTLSQATPDYDNVLFKRAEAQGFYLRILSLGASITAREHAPE